MEVKNYCPIIIATLNRFEHFKRCVESLQQCNNSDKTEIYISVDYPSKEAHKEGYEKIIHYLNDNPLTGFKKAHIYYQDKNLGVTNNFEFLIDKLSEKYEWYILLEDDNEFSIGFLNFINTTIERFKNDRNFYGVCGYSRLNKFKEQHWYKSVEATYGTAQAVKLCRDATKEINEIYGRVLSVKELLKVYRRCISYVENYADFLIHNNSVYYAPDGTIRPIDYTIGLWLTLKDKYVVQPTISYVRNHGCDGSGENSGLNVEINRRELSKKMYDKDDFVCEKKYEVSLRCINKLNKNLISLLNSYKGWIKIILIKCFGLNLVRKAFKIKNNMVLKLKKEG
jgi:hypothetical protein